MNPKSMSLHIENSYPSLLSLCPLCCSFVVITHKPKNFSNGHQYFIVHLQEQVLVMTVDFYEKFSRVTSIFN